MELDEFELEIWRRLRRAGFSKDDLMLIPLDEFINACLGKVLPGEIDFDFPLEAIVAFWFNRCVHKAEAMREIIFDIACYFRDRFVEFELSELPPPKIIVDARCLGKQLKLL